MGPVQASNVAGAFPPGTRLLVQNQGAGGAIGSSAFGQLGADWAATGSALDRYLAAHGAAGSTEPLVLGAFSAGGALLEHLLRDPVVRRRALVIGSFDAYYTAKDKAAKPGHLAAAEAAASSQGAPVVFTTDHIPGNATLGLPSSADAVHALLEPLGLGPIPLVDVPPAKCEAAAGRGRLGFYVYDYRGQSAAELRATHVQHATVLAPYFLPRLLSRRRSRGDGGDAVLALVGLLALLEDR